MKSLLVIGLILMSSCNIEDVQKDKLCTLVGPLNDLNLQVNFKNKRPETFEIYLNDNRFDNCKNLESSYPCSFMIDNENPNQVQIKLYLHQTFDFLDIEIAEVIDKMKITRIEAENVELEWIETSTLNGEGCGLTYSSGKGLNE